MAIISISGIRGIIGRDLTLNQIQEHVINFKDMNTKKKIAVGRDTRRTGPMITKMIEASLLADNIEVHSLGVTTTPSIYRYVSNMNLDGGIMITSSHNPSEWNGLKFIASKGESLSKEDYEYLKEKQKEPANKESFRRIGRKIIITETDYQKNLMNYIDQGIKTKLRIAVDCGGGSASIMIREVLERIGCEVKMINDKMGVFNREIDPTSDPLNQLCQLVKEEQYDLGLGFDCDGDRLVTIDEKGNKLTGDSTLLLSLLSCKRTQTINKIAISVDTSNVIEDFAVETGIKIKRTPVGESNVIQEMVKSKIKFGGEGSSGGFIASDFVKCRDGVLASALITQIISNNDPITSVLSSFPKYYREMKRIPICRNKSSKLMEILKKEIKDGEDIDGLKISLTKSSWVLIRSSQTENILRISSESDTKTKAKEITSEYYQKVKKIIEEEKI